MARPVGNTHLVGGGGGNWMRGGERMCDRVEKRLFGGGVRGGGGSRCQHGLKM